MEEIWLPIEEFPGYSVSSYGRIRNDKKLRIVKQSINQQGIAKVNFIFDGKRYTRSVAVLVASLFLEESYEHFNTPLHLDGDQTNNRADNLVWRPRWFTWKYRQQFKMYDYYKEFSDGFGPIVDIRSGLVYESLLVASQINGVLRSEIIVSLHSQLPVFPTFQIFGTIRN